MACRGRLCWLPRAGSAWAPAPAGPGLFMCRPRDLPPAHLAPHSLKGCRATGQKPDSHVYSPNTEQALWTLLRHPDPPLPLGKTGFQPTPRLSKTGTLTFRDRPPGGASKLALQQERVWSDTRKNFLPTGTFSSEKEEESRKAMCSLGKDSGQFCLSFRSSPS